MKKKEASKYIKFAKWVIAVVASCILIYLAIRYVHVVVNSIAWIIQLGLPIRKFDT